jgi:hypothetical protein
MLSAMLPLSWLLLRSKLLRQKTFECVAERGDDGACSHHVRQSRQRVHSVRNTATESIPWQCKRTAVVTQRV